MTLVIIAGPAGVGKGALVQRLLAESDRFTLSVSATTRDPRPGEVDGIHYHFVDEATFKNLIETGQLLEWAVVHGSNFYGTPVSELDRAKREGKHLILEIDVQGVYQVLEKAPEALDIFIEPPSFAELESRLRGRGTETELQIQRRLQTAADELAQAPRFRHRLVNDNLDECLKQVLDLVSATEGKND